MLDSTSRFLAANVKRLREQRDLTQRQLADLSGVPRPTLAHIESGVANPTLGVLVKVAAALSSTIEELIVPPKASVSLLPCQTLPQRTRSGVSVRTLVPEPPGGVSFERIVLPRGGRLSISGKTVGGWHYLACESGEYELRVGDEVTRGRAGDVVVVRGDTDRTLHHRGQRATVLYAVGSRLPV